MDQVMKGRMEGTANSQMQACVSDFEGSSSEVVLMSVSAADLTSHLHIAIKQSAQTARVYQLPSNQRFSVLHSMASCQVTVNGYAANMVPMIESDHLPRSRSLLSSCHDSL